MDKFASIDLKRLSVSITLTCKQKLHCIWFTWNNRTSFLSLEHYQIQISELDRLSIWKENNSFPLRLVFYGIPWQFFISKHFIQIVRIFLDNLNFTPDLRDSWYFSCKYSVFKLYPEYGCWPTGLNNKTKFIAFHIRKSYKSFKMRTGGPLDVRI